MTIRGLIFDFDGLILDTEWPEYQAWMEIYQEFGVDLPLQEYARCLGSTYQAFHPVEFLESLVNQKLDGAALLKRQVARSNHLLADSKALPGVQTYLDDAKIFGMKLAIASSSDRSWVMRNLDGLGLTGYFDAIRTIDEVKPAKPHPNLYLAALNVLGLEPHEAIAFEDSPNGITAARAAQIYVVAVPNRLSSMLDTSHANRCLPSLESLSLKELIGEVENQN
ncbi:MAG TPA: HAD-IA family hydrolase [Longilinea sp.]|nr:HAD-IA family hydrolase [Longilinea sp.]